MAQPQDSTEMVAEALKQIGKIISTFPENIREALKPYEDPKKLAREARERQMSREDFLQAQAATKAIQANCPHKDKNERWAVNLVHNFPDHQPRGTCPLCGVWIHPAQWQIGPPTDKHPRGEPYIMKEHPLYHVVRFLESQS